MALGGIGVVLLFLAAVGEAATGVEPGHVPPFARSSFPAGFVFGAASSAHQVEGAANEGGRGPSIWDTFTHKRPDFGIISEDQLLRSTYTCLNRVLIDQERATQAILQVRQFHARFGSMGTQSALRAAQSADPEMIADRSTADVAIDSYHRYKEDVGIMKNIGLDAYRFSFSWSRIIPTGSLSEGVNKEGIQYYNNLINELLSKGVQPYVTLLHWDVPQGLEDKYGGFRSPLIVNDFRDYADVCFKEFGDRVKKWITLNEPWSFSQRGYAAGVFAPGRCSPFVGSHCTVGDSSREPYLVAHHMLLAHAAAVKQYKTKYQASQKGQIGITLVSNWFLPYSNTKASQDAVQRALDFMFGWFMDPLTQGDYPFTMRALVGDRLPPFTETQSEMVKGSYDFLGLNYYTSNYANTISLLSRVNVSYDTDIHAVETGVRNGVPIGPQATGSDWLYIYPRGLRDLLLYVKNNYNNPTIYITENGVDEPNNATLPLEEALKDNIRIDYHYRHLLFVNLAIKEGVNVKGYFAWTLFDDFEWDAGFTVRFGLNFVDFKNGLKRYPKHSAFWYQKFLKG